MIDEGPSPEDIERFSDETGYCPACGAEVWDATPRCPECGAWIEGATEAQHPEQAAARRKMVALIAILTLIGFTGLLAILRIF
ncbi:MAG: hypothetical protein ACYTGP_00100 [Planctomycetota bacterium]|jgi:predicted amidophosphoribosyltransferase